MSATSSPSGVEPVTEPKQPERSLGELFADLGGELSALVRKELELAKSETRHEVRHASRAGASFAVAGIAALLALMFVSSAFAWLLDQWINRALSFLIVALIWAAIVPIGVRAGQRRWRQIEPMPETVETLKEDVEWMKQQKS
jgi:Putative Actinobacterial Holin-X, holin superfamily III